MWWTRRGEVEEMFRGRGVGVVGGGGGGVVVIKARAVGDKDVSEGSRASRVVVLAEYVLS